MKYFIIFSLLASSHINAQLREISDQKLAQIDGQNDSAIAFIADDIYATSDDAELILDFDSGIPLVFNNFYWVGHDSDTSGNSIYGADIGSYQDPFFINLQDESTTLANGTELNAATLVFSFPEGQYKNGNQNIGRMDLGTLMTLEHESGNIDETWLLFNGIDLDRTYIKYWAPEGGGLAMSGQLDFHADELVFQTASNGDQPSDDLATAWKITDFDLFLPVGNSLYQPLTIDTNEDQHLVIEIAAIDQHSAAQFYQQPTGELHAGNITINDWNSGSSTISGVQLQHLRIETHDL